MADSKEVKVVVGHSEVATEKSKAPEVNKPEDNFRLSYYVNDVPSWYLTVLLAFQVSFIKDCNNCKFLL